MNHLSNTRAATGRPSRKAGRRGMRQPAAILLLGLAVLLPGCDAGGHGTAETTAASTATPSGAPYSDSASPRASAGRPVLPSGFPIPAGAVPGQPPAEDPSLIAQWTLDEVGSGPYDYYLAALPVAGYRIVGSYPAEDAALVRFEVAPGTVWQLLLERAGNATRVTVQTDRP
jgi:hypothetical protein